MSNFSANKSFALSFALFNDRTKMLIWLFHLYLAYFRTVFNFPRSLHLKDDSYDELARWCEALYAL